MKRTALALAFGTMLTASQANTLHNLNFFLKDHTPVVSQPKPAIKKEQHFVSRVRIPVKPKLFRSNPLRKNLILLGSDPAQTIDDEDLIFSRPRSRVNNNQDDIELSDRVKFRLWLARQLALKKFNEVWGQKSHSISS
jgi:hypothetical protein